MSKIIIINGCGGCGKDQFVKFFKHENIMVHNKSTIESVKEIGKLMGWNGEKNELSRKFLAELKQLWINFNDTIFNNVIEYCELHNKNDNTFIFIHCREPKEIKRFKNYFKENCITLLIERPEYIITSNSADCNVNNYEYDKILFNNKSLKHLKKLANDFRQELIGDSICG